MRPATILLAKGFWGRSLDEFKRQANIVITSETIHGAKKPRILTSFHDSNSLEDIKLMSDKDIGGFSKAHVEYIPPNTSSILPLSENKSGHMRFTGNISIELPPNKPDVHRSGYAAWRTSDRKATVFGKSFWDIDPYAFLAIRFKSDGRSYFVNLQTDSIVPTDIHQHRLYARRPGEWETVLIKWGDFVRTNHGMVVEPQSEMLRQRVKSVGIGLIDRIPGPFDLSVERIWASNEMGEDLVKEDSREEQGLLRGKLGERARWGSKNEEKR